MLRYLLAAFVPVTLLISLTLEAAILTHSPWQEPITGGGYFPCLVIPPLLAGDIMPSELPMAAVALAVLVICAWGVGTLALAHRLGWALTGAPAVYLLLAGILWKNGRMLTRARRGADWAATLLLMLVISIADLSGFWWRLLVVSLLTLGGRAGAAPLVFSAAPQTHAGAGNLCSLC